MRPTELNALFREHDNQVDDLQKKLMAISQADALPRCDKPWLNELNALREELEEQKRVTQRVRCRVTYWKKKAQVLIA